MLDLPPSVSVPFAAFLGSLISRWLDITALRRALEALTSRVAALEQRIRGTAPSAK